MTYEDLNYRMTAARMTAANQQAQSEQTRRMHEWLLQQQTAQATQARYAAGQANFADLDARLADAMRRNHERLMWEALFGSPHGQTTNGTNTAPPPARKPDNHWSTVLGVAPSATVAEVKAAYRALAKTAHPDQGGTEAAIKRLNIAKDQALKERGAK